MKNITTKLLASFLFATLFSSCDWSSGGEAASYNGRYQWVNFDGVYRPISGKYVVTDYSSGVPAAPGTPEESYVNTASQQVATGNGASTLFNGTVSNKDIVPGSFSISSAGFILTDDGAGTLSGTGVSGTIEYLTGVWSVDFGGAAPDAGSAIRASYAYNVTVNAVPGTDAQSPRPGSTGFELFSFTVAQGGERITLTDNTGRQYTGNMGTVRSTNGASQDTTSDVANVVVGDQIIGLFTCKGVSPAGKSVTITGTLQATVGAGGTLNERLMFGTWIEAGGVSGDINAQAGPVSIVGGGTTPTPVTP